MFATLHSREVSVAALTATASAFTPRFQIIGSLVLLDASGVSRLFGDAHELGRALQSAQPAAQAKPGEHVPRLSIVNLRNGSFEPNLEIKYSNYLRQEFATGSGAQVVGGMETADYVLKGTILSVLIPTLSFTQSTTLESRVEAIVMVQAEDVRSHKVVWVQTAKGASEFFVTTDLQFNRVLQNRAVEQAGRMMAADLSARFQLFIDDVREGKVKPTEAPPEFVPMLPGAR